jgi:uncharacterized small protein (DUF1192 family)
MSREIPDTDARNAEMFRVWFESGNDSLLRAGRRQWPKEKYRMVPPVAVFDEHVARNGDGSTTHYEHKGLSAIVRNMNDRIRKTGNYAALTDGHTTDDPADQQPEVLGYSGPFYLGQVGNEGAPRWAVFSVEWHRKSAAPILDTHRTRSPEVWLTPRLEDRVMDPIAALGAERPRRDLGMARYSLSGSQHEVAVERYAARGITRLSATRVQGQRSGIKVERYAAAAMPGGANTFVPDEKYSADEPETEGRDSMALSDEDARKIAQYAADILEETPWVQFVKSMMAGDKGPDDVADTEAVTDDDHDEPDGDEVSDDDSQVMADFDDEDDEEDGGEGEAGAAPAPAEAASDVDDGDDDGDETESAGDTSGSSLEAVSPESGASPDVLMDRITSLQAENARLKQQLAKVGGEKKEHYRRATLAALRKKGHQIDIDECAQLSEDFDDVQFERYAKSLERNSVRVPLADEVGDLPVERPKKTESSGGDLSQPGNPKMARYAKRAMEKYRAEVQAGRPADYNKLVEDAIAGRI